MECQKSVTRKVGFEEGRKGAEKGMAEGAKNLWCGGNQVGARTATKTSESTVVVLIGVSGMAPFLSLLSIVKDTLLT